MRGEDLTSEDAFDFIYTQISLHEMDDARVVLANARRALKDDGTLLITEIRGPERIEDCAGDVQRRAVAHRPVLRDPAGRREGRPRRRLLHPGARSRRWPTDAGLRNVRELELEQPLYAAFAAGEVTLANQEGALQPPHAHCSGAATAPAA